MIVCLSDRFLLFSRKEQQSQKKRKKNKQNLVCFFLEKPAAKCLPGLVPRLDQKLTLVHAEAFIGLGAFFNEEASKQNGVGGNSLDQLAFQGEATRDLEGATG